jgi:hypothetical protein
MYPKHPYERLASAEMMAKLPELQNSEADVVLAAYETRKPQLEEATRGMPCKPIYKYFVDIKRKLFFVSEVNPDPNEDRILGKYRGWPYKRLNKPSELKSQPDLQDKNTRVVIYSY